jgi:hypothetical protein
MTIAIVGMRRTLQIAICELLRFQCSGHQWGKVSVFVPTEEIVDEESVHRGLVARPSPATARVDSEIVNGIQIVCGERPVPLLVLPINSRSVPLVPHSPGDPSGATGDIFEEWLGPLEVVSMPPRVHSHVRSGVLKLTDGSREDRSVPAAYHAGIIQTMLAE